MSEHDPSAWLASIAEIFDDLGLDWTLIGALAANLVAIHKLIAWRPRDRDDIRSILEAGVALDSDYLERWVAAWELDERWATFA
ncbi:MAG: hypothetical protein ACE367_26065 [Acidimicrobiales bacterium]